MNWTQATLGDVCVPTSQRTPASNSGSFRYIDIAGIDRDAKVIATANSIRCNEAPSRARKEVKADDILVSTVRPNLNAVAQVPPELDGEIASTGFAVLRADRTLVHPRYLFYRVQHQEFIDTLVANATGASYPAVSDAIVRRAPLPLPPPSEQRRIVEILDQANALRKLCREADAKAARILPALFTKMFGDPATNPMEWPTAELKDLGKPLSGGAFPLDEQGLSKGDIPFVKVSDMNTVGNEFFIRAANHWVSKSTLQRLRVKPAPAGTTIFPKIGAAVATNKKRLLARETAYDNNVIGVVPRGQIWALYLHAFFLLFDLSSLTRTTAVPSIKSSELARLPIAVPDEARVQLFNQQFRLLLGLFEQQGKTTQLLEHLFRTLLHRAFSGRLTAKWREGRMKELLAEMAEQARLLNLPAPQALAS